MNKHLKQCIKEVRWDRITAAMATLKWEWYGKDGPYMPSIKDLQETTYKLYHSAKELARTNPSCHSEVGTGGLAVKVWVDEETKKVDTVMVRFILEDVCSYDE